MRVYVGVTVLIVLWTVNLDGHPKVMVPEIEKPKPPSCLPGPLTASLGQLFKHPVFISVGFADFPVFRLPHSHVIAEIFLAWPRKKIFFGSLSHSRIVSASPGNVNRFLRIHNLCMLCTIHWNLVFFLTWVLKKQGRSCMLGVSRPGLYPGFAGPEAKPRTARDTRRPNLPERSSGLAKNQGPDRAEELREGPTTSLARSRDRLAAGVPSRGVNRGSTTGSRKALSRTGGFAWGGRGVFARPLPPSLRNHALAATLGSGPRPP
jgi:hypothetical protein